MWKNCDANYKGLVHYRRLFASPSLANRLQKDRFAESHPARRLGSAWKDRRNVPCRRNYYIKALALCAHARWIPSGRYEGHSRVEGSRIRSHVRQVHGLYWRPHVQHVRHARRPIRRVLRMAFLADDELTKRIDASASPHSRNVIPARVQRAPAGRVAFKSQRTGCRPNCPLLSPEPTDWWKKATGFLMAKFAGRKYAKSF